jgi:hypothetical protein
MSVPTTVSRPAPGAGYRHSCDHGFCAVCGAVWPCRRAPSDQPAPTVPVPRLAAMGAPSG